MLFRSEVTCDRDLVGYVVIPRNALKEQNVRSSQFLGLTAPFGLTAEKQPLAATLNPLVGWFAVDTQFDDKQGHFLYIAYKTPGVKWFYFAERWCRDVKWEHWRDWWKDSHPLEYAALKQDLEEQQPSDGFGFEGDIMTVHDYPLPETASRTPH